MQALVAEHGMSERRACQASGIARSTLRYRPVARDDSGVIAFIQLPGFIGLTHRRSLPV